MNMLFYIACGVAVISAGMAVSRSNAIHALLYLVVSLLATGLIFFILGAPFAAALEVIIYAGAVMVLFVFVIMMLNLGGSDAIEKDRVLSGGWAGPVILALILASEIAYAVGSGAPEAALVSMVGPQEVSESLFGPYALGVEICSALLLSGLVGAFRLAGRIDPKDKERGDR